MVCASGLVGVPFWLKGCGLHRLWRESETGRCYGTEREDWRRTHAAAQVLVLCLLARRTNQSSGGCECLAFKLRCKANLCGRKLLLLWNKWYKLPAAAGSLSDARTEVGTGLMRFAYGSRPTPTCGGGTPATLMLLIARASVPGSAWGSSLEAPAGTRHGSVSGSRAIPARGWSATSSEAPPTNASSEPPLTSRCGPSGAMSVGASAVSSSSSSSGLQAFDRAFDRACVRFLCSYTHIINVNYFKKFPYLRGTLSNCKTPRS